MTIQSNHLRSRTARLLSKNSSVRHQVSLRFEAEPSHSVISSALSCEVMKLENFIEIGSGFYNLKTPFVLGAVFDIGNQMSLLRLHSTGRYIVIDTCSLTPAAKAELDFLTDGGKLIDAVVASHPYHTMFFVPFHKMYPTLKYYGTPRHIRTIPTIQWTGDVSTEAVQTLWSPEVTSLY